MGLLTILKKLKEKEKEVRLLVLGLDNAGKTNQEDSGPTQWIWDTGSGNHLISPADLTQRDLLDAVKTKETIYNSSLGKPSGRPREATRASQRARKKPRVLTPQALL